MVDGKKERSIFLQTKFDNEADADKKQMFAKMIDKVVNNNFFYLSLYLFPFTQKG